jgi:hypothetical protein
MAAVNLQTRKPVHELTLDDFAAFPVWEYASDEEAIDGRDETWVRPVPVAFVPQRSYAHVAADFTAANGKRFAGFVTVSTLDGPPDVCQGVILHGRGYLFVANAEAFGYRASREHLLAALGLREVEVFPLSFHFRVPVAGRALYRGGALP